MAIQDSSFAVTVTCDVCMKEIPNDGTGIEEVEDYVLYFCGLECYRFWREQNPGGQG